MAVYIYIHWIFCIPKENYIKSWPLSPIDVFALLDVLKCSHIVKYIYPCSIASLTTRHRQTVMNAQQLLGFGLLQHVRLLGKAIYWASVLIDLLWRKTVPFGYCGPWWQWAGFDSTPVGTDCCWMPTNCFSTMDMLKCYLFCTLADTHSPCMDNHLLLGCFLKYIWKKSWNKLPDLGQG